MTTLYVVRHAVAAAKTPDADDAARPLTPKGLRRWREAVRGLERLGVGFDRLYHSPWLRAVETADELVGLVEGETVVTALLAQPPTQALLDELQADCIAVVGHQPWLGELIGLLVLGRPEAGDRFELKKGSVICLEGELRHGGMVLTSSLPPKVLRAIGG